MAQVTAVAQSAPGTQAPRISIAGAGNWLLTHDRVGPRVLELLVGRYGPAVELCELGSRGLGLLDHLHGQELLLVVDACLFGGAPGEVRLVEPDLEEGAGTGVVSVHQIGPLEALAVARALYPEQLPRRIRLVLVETGGLDGPAEQDACARVVALLDREVEAWYKMMGEALDDETQITGSPEPTSPPGGAGRAAR